MMAVRPNVKCNKAKINGFEVFINCFEKQQRVIATTQSFSVNGTVV